MYRVKGDGVMMPRAVLTDATLTEAHLSNAKLADANFSRANLSRAIFSNTDFKGAQFNNANLTGAQFQGGQFQNAHFDGTILIDAKLENADFSGANMFRAQGLKQAQLDEACGDERTRLPAGLSLPYCGDIQPRYTLQSSESSTGDINLVSQRLNRAISDIENLLAASNPRDRALRTRLQRVHNDLVESKAALER